MTIERLDLQRAASAAWILLLACCAGPGEASRTELGPHPQLYSPYLADPRDVGTGIQLLSVPRDRIEHASDLRWRLQAGGRVGLVRREADAHRMQLEGEAGFAGEFDLGNGNSNIGWDGTYGLLLAWKDDAQRACRFGVHHVSSHIGDEHIEETGRRRLNVTREEILFGVSARPGARWRVYGEGGWAYHLGNYALQERTRVQGGLEYEGPQELWGGRLGWYAASDLSAYAEDDWQPNAALQLGLLRRGNEALPVGRFGIELYAGRSRLGEFFESRETVLAIGFWL